MIFLEYLISKQVLLVELTKLARAGDSRPTGQGNGERAFSLLFEVEGCCDYILGFAARGVGERVAQPPQLLVALGQLFVLP